MLKNIVCWWTSVLMLHVIPQWPLSLSSGPAGIWHWGRQANLPLTDGCYHRAQPPHLPLTFIFAFCQEEWRRPGVAASWTLRRNKASNHNTLPSSDLICSSGERCCHSFVCLRCHRPHCTYQANYPSIPLSIAIKQLPYLPFCHSSGCCCSAFYNWYLLMNDVPLITQLRY